MDPETFAEEHGIDEASALILLAVFGSPPLAAEFAVRGRQMCHEEAVALGEGLLARKVQT
jgi:hypothetical protein